MIGAGFDKPSANHLDSYGTFTLRQLNHISFSALCRYTHYKGAICRAWERRPGLRQAPEPRC